MMLRNTTGGPKTVWSRDNFIENGRSEYLAWTGFNDATNEGNYEWSSKQTTNWTELTDLICAQNWFDQRGHFDRWDYGLLVSIRGGKRRAEER